MSTHNLTFDPKPGSFWEGMVGDRQTTFVGPPKPDGTCLGYIKRIGRGKYRWYAFHEPVKLTTKVRRMPRYGDFKNGWSISNAIWAIRTWHINNHKAGQEAKPPQKPAA